MGSEMCIRDRWKTFCSWRKERQVASTSIPVIFDFLQDGVDLGLKVSTLRVQIAALSVYLDRRLAKEDLIKRFLLAREFPALKGSCPPWDLTRVLEAFSILPFETIEEVPFKFLTLKLAFLLAITTARRVGDLQAWSMKEPFLRVQPDRVTLRADPLYLPKVASLFNRTQDILPSFLF